MFLCYDINESMQAKENIPLKDILLYHVAHHPSITPQDILKLCYQATFGAEHLLTDETRARSFFQQEWEAVSASDTALTEPLSSRYVRVHLGAWKHAGLPKEWLFRMFFMTASIPSGSVQADLLARLNTVDSLAKQGQFPFSYSCWKTACDQYLQCGGGAVHHSDAYRNAEHPAYRVVEKKYADLIPLLIKLSAFHNHSTPINIAIDGRAASGKSTLAKSLSYILDAGVIHMDDFFLPPELRTAERLSRAGGNVHYERFAEQVLPHLKSNGAFDYPIFDCSKMQLDGARTVPAGEWRIIEGSYSHHPHFSDYMDIRVFCTVTAEEQRQRILLRNGEQMAQMFAQRWIPMEETYFKSYQIRENADIIMDTGSKEYRYETDL